MKRLWVISMGLVCLTGLCGCGPGAPESSAASREESAVSAPSQGETTASTIRTRPTEPDDGFDDVCPEFPSRTYEYVSTKEQSLEEIVDALVKLYLEDMMTPRDNKSFTITEYRNLSVDIQSPDEVDNDIHRKVYPRQWVCYITFEYHYEGICSPHGPPPGDWIPGGYFEGFLVENCGYTYRMRWNNSGGGSLFKDLIPA